MSLARKSTATVEQYKSNEISTVSQGKLIVMLYDGAIRFLNIALENNTPPEIRCGKQSYTESRRNRY